MTTITNLAAVAAAVIVTSYSTNVTHTDNAERKSWQEPTWTLMYPPEANQRTVTATLKPPTERYERVTITEHKTATVTMTNGLVMKQELTNRVVSDRIRTYRLIQTEEFVDEKDAPKPVYLRETPIDVWDGSFTNYITSTNLLLWTIDSGTNITEKEPEP